jgi:hypothetical protein
VVDYKEHIFDTLRNKEVTVKNNILKEKNLIQGEINLEILVLEL